MDAKLVLDEKYYYLEVQHERIGKMIVGSSDHELSRIVNHQFKLSTKNCDVIKNGYDLDELINKLDTPEGYDQYQYDSGIRKGFELAVELLGDKKFNEKEMWNMFYFGDSLKNQIKSGKIENKPMGEIFDEYIQPLQQKEWMVEIEMEEVYDGLDEMAQKQYIRQPKLDADGCLILKRK